MHKVFVCRQEWVRGLRSQGAAENGRWAAGPEDPPARGETRPQRVRVESPGADAEKAAAGGVTDARPAWAVSPLQLKPAGLW